MASYLEMKAMKAAPENKALGGPPENKAKPEPTRPEHDPLDGIEFASASARRAAVEAGLTVDAFRRKRKSGRGFTKSDVESIAESGES